MLPDQDWDEAGIRISGHGLEEHPGMRSRRALENSTSVRRRIPECALSITFVAPAVSAGPASIG